METGTYPGPVPYVNETFYGTARLRAPWPRQVPAGAVVQGSTRDK
jgi:hypothetical protein